MNVSCRLVFWKETHLGQVSSVYDEVRNWSSARRKHSDQRDRHCLKYMLSTMEERYIAVCQYTPNASAVVDVGPSGHGGLHCLLGQYLLRGF
jgi:hypothetical protein